MIVRKCQKRRTVVRCGTKANPTFRESERTFRDEETSGGGGGCAAAGPRYEVVQSSREAAWRPRFGQTMDAECVRPSVSPERTAAGGNMERGEIRRMKFDRHTRMHLPPAKWGNVTERGLLRHHPVTCEFRLPEPRPAAPLSAPSLPPCGSVTGVTGLTGSDRPPRAQNDTGRSDRHTQASARGRAATSSPPSHPGKKPVSRASA